MTRISIILITLLLPLSVWAMTPVTDSDLSNVTGQAGVNINADLTMDIAIGTMAWGDNDGIKSAYNPWNYDGSGNTGGYIGISGFNIYNLSIKARTNVLDNYNHYNTLMLKPITIDVATTTAGIAGEAMAAGTTFVRFGLGALQVSLDSLQFDVALAQRADSNTNANATAGTNTINLNYGASHMVFSFYPFPTWTLTPYNHNLGQVSMGGISMWINPWSYVDIFSTRGLTTGATNSGVAFAVNVTLDRFTMEYMSWGDHDGITNTSSVNWMTDTGAGYIGLNKFLVNGPIEINGTVAIDINTTSAGIYAKLPNFIDWLTLTSPNPIDIVSTTQPQFLYSLASSWFYAMPTLLQTGITNAYNGYVSSGIINSSLVTLDMFVASTYGESSIVPWIEAYYGSHASTTTASVVHIAFPTQFIVNVKGSITGAVELSNSATFASSGVNSALGDIYISGFKMTMHSGSWVDIWAH